MDTYDPALFLDMKLALQELILKKLPTFDPSRDATFLTYLHHFIYDTFKRFRMQQECWTIDSLDTYKPTRRMAAIYNANCQDKKKSIEIFCRETGYTQKKAEEYLAEAIGIRARQTEVIIDRDEDDAAHISTLFEDMERGMRDWDSFGLLRVGASVTIGSQFLPNYVKAFYSRYPGTEVRVLVAPSDELEQKILSSELDFALIEGVAHHPSILSEEYMEDQLAVICPADGRFQNGQFLTVDEFKKQQFLLREPGSDTREVFDRAAESAGFRVQPIGEAMSTTALVNAVINGLGIAVLPQRMVTGPLEKGLVTTVRVEGMDFRRRFHMIWHKEKYLTGSAKAFMDLCRNYEADYPLPRYSGLL